MRTRDKLQFTELTVQHRYDTVHGDPTSPKTGWCDSTGYNNPTSTYNHLSQARSQITRQRRHLERHYTGVEFRIMARQVTRTTWAELVVIEAKPGA